MPLTERAGVWLPGLDAQIEPRIPAPRAQKPLGGRYARGMGSLAADMLARPPNRPWGGRIGHSPAVLPVGR